MKIAISGKGGVGKTTISAMLAAAVSLSGKDVVALDADPDANLAAALGYDEPITPLAEMRELIAERTGSGDAVGGYFKLNPRVDDIPDKYARRIGNIRLIVLGGVERGGAGCICPATAVLKALLVHLALARDDALIMDMEAGIEHLGRATAQSTDAMIIVVDDRRWSIKTALLVRKLAADLGVTNLLAVANQVRESTDVARIQRELGDIPLIAQVPYDERLQGALTRVTDQGTLEATQVLKDHIGIAEAILSKVSDTM